MNPGQQQFMDYILERVMDGKAEEARAVLQENFKKQAEGTFTRDDAVSTMPRIIVLLKPDKVEEVQAVMKQFAGSVNR